MPPVYFQVERLFGHSSITSPFFESIDDHIVDEDDDGDDDDEDDCVTCSFGMPHVATGTPAIFTAASAAAVLPCPTTQFVGVNP